MKEAVAEAEDMKKEKIEESNTVEEVVAVVTAAAEAVAEEVADMGLLKDPRDQKFLKLLQAVLSNYTQITSDYPLPTEALSTCTKSTSDHRFQTKISMRKTKYIEVSEKNLRKYLAFTDHLATIFSL